MTPAISKTHTDPQDTETLEGCGIQDVRITAQVPPGKQEVPEMPRENHVGSGQASYFSRYEEEKGTSPIGQSSQVYQGGTGGSASKDGG